MNGLPDSQFHKGHSCITGSTYGTESAARSATEVVPEVQLELVLLPEVVPEVQLEVVAEVQLELVAEV